MKKIFLTLFQLFLCVFITNAQNWTLKGNIIDSTNFLGTKNNNPLIFRTNNIYSGMIDPVYSNIFLGMQAGKFPAIGTHNVGIGNYALAKYKGKGNTAVGDSALANNTRRQYGLDACNTAFGYHSLSSATTSSHNTGVGYSAISSNTTGDLNTGVGSLALTANITGSSNTAIGYIALYGNSTGNNNTAIGAFALSDNYEGNINSATGHAALSNSQYGSYNTSNGAYSLYYNYTGSYNTAVGSSALYNNVSGSYNMGIGIYSDVTKGNLTNASAIGYNAKVRESNNISIGNTAITSIGGQVSWTTFSDGRYKNNIQQNVPGLDFINKLNPVTFVVDAHAIEKQMNINLKERKDENGKPLPKYTDDQIFEIAINEQSRIIHTGFVAQEVENAARGLNYDFSGIDKPKDEANGFYGLRYSEFVVPLVKAVQELSTENEELKSRLKNIEELLQKLQANSVNKNISSDDNTILEQNIPNPFKSNTSIGYSIPADAKNAIIFISDMTGKNIKQIILNKPGTGTVSVDASTLNAGIYNYSLMIDGKYTDTKKMVIVR